MDFMRVSPPSPPGATIRRSEITSVKLARNVSLLFGVDVPSNPAGVVWVSDFNKVAVGDIGRGGPKGTRKDAGYLPERGWYLVERTLVSGPSGSAGNIAKVSSTRVKSIEEIPAATLNRYAPDTKAAAILAGSETLFSQLESTFVDVLRVVGTSDDGNLLADFMRVGVWAALIAEVYRSQPALFAAAVQARLTQRAALSTWAPRVHGEEDVQGASCEFGLPDQNKWQPYSLGILDRVIREFVRPYFGSEDPSGDDTQEPDREYLIDGLVDRWVRHLTQSPSRGTAWTLRNGKRHSVEVYQSGQEPLGRFIAEVLLLSPKILAVSTSETQEWVAFNPSDPSHRERVRPRVPSLAELSSLPEKSQAAVIYTLGCLHRVLRTKTSFNDRDMLREVSEDQERVALLAENLWGKDSPHSTVAKILWLRGKIMTDRESQSEFVESHWPQLIDGMNRLHQLRERGKISVGEWIDIFHTTSPTINVRVRDLAVQNRIDESKRLHNYLLEEWQKVFELLEININQEIEDALDCGEPDISMARVAMLLHNYLGVAVRSNDVQKRTQAIRFGYSVVIPLRRYSSQNGKNDTAIRRTMQITSGAASRLAMETQVKELRQEMLQICKALFGQLCNTVLAREMLVEDRAPSKTSDLDALNAIVETGINLVEGGVDLSPLELEFIEKAVDLASKVLDILSGGNIVDSKIESERSRKTKQFKVRWSAQLRHP